MEMGIILELVNSLGPVGFVLWLVWRTTSHTIPRLADSFELNLEKQRETFAAMAKEAREDFLTQNNIQKDFFQDQVERERELVREKIKRKG